MMPLFREKRRTIEAMQWNGPPDDADLSAFAQDKASIASETYVATADGGQRRLFPGDYVIRTGQGRLEVWQPSRFEANYERA